MTERITLNIHEIVGSPLWISTDDGLRVYQQIMSALRANKIVEISFSGRETMITAFLNAAIGQLYNGTYSQSFLDEHLIFSDVSSDDHEMLVRSIANAKRYFTNRPSYDEAWGDVLDEE